MPFVSQNKIDQLAGRIERAYLHRGAHWKVGCSTPRVWAAAARALLQCQIEDPDSPLDPELYVAAQGIDPDTPDPWAELASPGAQSRYRRRVQSIVRQLRSELHHEIRRAERAIESGRSIDAVLSDLDPRFSPLGRYIVAQRALRTDLAEEWTWEALEQHRSCPLYRVASLGFLLMEDYPSDRSDPPRTPYRIVGSLN